MWLLRGSTRLENDEGCLWVHYPDTPPRTRPPLRGPCPPHQLRYEFDSVVLTLHEALHRLRDDPLASRSHVAVTPLSNLTFATYSSGCTCLVGWTWTHSRSTVSAPMPMAIFRPSPVPCSPFVVGRCARSGRRLLSKESALKSAPNLPVVMLPVWTLSMYLMMEATMDTTHSLSRSVQTVDDLVAGCEDLGVRVHPQASHAVVNDRRDNADMTVRFHPWAHWPDRVAWHHPAWCPPRKSQGCPWCPVRRGNTTHVTGPSLSRIRASRLYDASKLLRHHNASLSARGRTLVTSTK